MHVLNYMLIGVLFASWVALFALKDFTRDTDRRIAQLEAQIEREEDAIRDLMTDWAVLNEPGYLQQLAETHLGLDALAPNQIVTMAALPMTPLDAEPAPFGTYLASVPASAGRARNAPDTVLVDADVLNQHAPAFEVEYVNWARPALNPTGERTSR